MLKGSAFILPAVFADINIAKADLYIYYLDAMQVPSRDDWGQINENDLDAKWAFDAFLGKSFADAEAMFEKNALYYQEDLQSIPYVPFNYYAPALISDRAKGDSDGASSFLRLIIWLLKSNRTVMTPQTEQSLVAVVVAATRTVIRELPGGNYPRFYVMLVCCRPQTL